MMNIFRLRRSAPWRGRLVADSQYAFSVEEAVASVRLVLVALSLAVSLALYGVGGPSVASAILFAMAGYAAVAAVAIRTRRVRFPFHAVLFHVADVAGIVLCLMVTGGAFSPFSTLFLFPMLAAGYRWGRLETWLTAGVGVIALSLHGLAVDLGPGLVGSQHEILPLRLAYFTMGAVVIGSMAEAERRRRCRGWSVVRILALVRADSGLVAAVRAVLGELVEQFGASHGVLVLQEEGSDSVSLWQVERRRDNLRHPAVRLKQVRHSLGATYLVPVPDGVDAFSVRRFTPGAAPDGASVGAMDSSGGRVTTVFPATPIFKTPFEWTTAFCVSALAGQGWSGRLILFMPFDPVASREQLRFLQAVVHQVSPALFNLYLQRRLQSRAGAIDRARISRELHDGVVQSLIGVEMQLEAARLAAGGIPHPVVAKLADAQRLLGQEILNVRDLMRLLKPVEVAPRLLVAHLVETVEHFRHRTGINARFTADADEVDLSPRACREVAGIVQEALTNVRKHAEATSVLVRLGRSGADWLLVVDDDGKGLDFDGRLSTEELETQRKGPVIIRERVRAAGGRLSVHSHPGLGTRLEISIPR
jgi:signal transduction histidine kinase